MSRNVTQQNSLANPNTALTIHLHTQTQSEWIDMDMETEALLNNSYAAVKDILSRNRCEGDLFVCIITCGML